MPKTVVITQSNYLPWRGYFDLLQSADEIVLLDSVQYTRRDWRNRNRIKTAHGLEWLTVSVETKGQFSQAIDETRISDPAWAAQHIRTIELAYARAAHFREVSPWLFALLRSVADEPFLSQVNERLLRELCAVLGIRQTIRRCTDVIERDALRAMQPTERLVAIASALEATRYITGPAARDYLDTGQFAAAGIDVVWMAYDGYPEYSQLWGGFEPHVSIVDLVLNVGAAEAPRFLTRDAG
ncbi:MAG: WbqC family protein [Xanthobacteraceae bacterium]